jgi:hypothetical protein
MMDFASTYPKKTRNVTVEIKRFFSPIVDSSHAGNRA